MSTTFQKELESLLNRHSMEGGSNTPDFILAKYLVSCLVSFNSAVSERTDWYAPETPQEAAKRHMELSRVLDDRDDR
jgi:hypothetical protein